MYYDILLWWLSVLFCHSLTCNTGNTDLFYSHSRFGSLCVFSSPVPSFYLLSFSPRARFPSVICLAEWELERGFVFFVTVCDVPSDPSKCLKLHYISLSILPAKPLCHSVSVCEQEEGWAEVLIFPCILYRDAKHTQTLACICWQGCPYAQNACLGHAFMHKGMHIEFIVLLLKHWGFLLYIIDKEAANCLFAIKIMFRLSLHPPDSFSLWASSIDVWPSHLRLSLFQGALVFLHICFVEIL